ncbi:WAT1-related protein At4g08290-like isoform X2 [Dendrobium catenatum]|uniref:WAT1-related protein At4g08290-like isoform X2 n=1 Tax=Dendrobium catenatum TaxID=906689 RepID=UPI0009F4635A|nr:WAT1-related protein At4g08290-like isoform X2 [Dendrobium catenatum]
MKGTFMIIGSSTSWSAFLILQSNTLELYPAELTLTALICSMGAVMSTTVALVANHASSKPWIIVLDKRLLAPIYTDYWSYYNGGMSLPTHVGKKQRLSKLI